ncbi:MAG: LysR family transcriptional regulator [bacterium]
MEFNALQAFLAVADAHSFSRAAVQLHMTQPAISKRIATLEASLDVKLFDRIGKRTHLTEAGYTLLPKARAILSEVDESRRLMRNLSGEIGGKLTLGTSHHIGLHRLPEVLRTFHREHNSVTLDIQFTDSELACDAVIRGDLEMAVITLPVEPHAKLSCFTVWEDPMYLVVGKQHPLAELEHCTLADLADHDALLPGSNTVTRAIIDREFAREELTPRLGMETNYLETLGKMVSIGLGWSALPLTLINRDMCRLPVDSLSLSRNLGLVQHKERTPSNAGRAFKQLLLSISQPGPG